MSGILSSSIWSVEYSTATFRDLRVWSAEERVEEAILSLLFLFLEVRGCSVCSLLSLSPCVSDMVDSISSCSEELLTAQPWYVASPSVGLLLHAVCFVLAMRLSGHLLTLFGK